MQKRLLFIHHSTGANLIRQGQLRSHLHHLAPNLELWDHSYNLYPTFPRLLAQLTHHTGLSNATGHLTGTDFNIVLSNNSPKEYAELFARSPHDSTLRAILDFDIVAFKNCYLTTRIISDHQLAQHKSYYQQIRDSLSQYPTKQFILFTPPPLRQNATTSANAQRAQQLVAWLNSPEFLHGTTNLRVFDFFGLLADTNGFLKKEYQRFLPWDSHPNLQANQTIAPFLATYLSHLLY
jgi:hypothetical protein